MIRDNSKELESKLLQKLRAADPAQAQQILAFLEKTKQLTLRFSEYLPPEHLQDSGQKQPDPEKSAALIVGGAYAASVGDTQSRGGQGRETLCLASLHFEHLPPTGLLPDTGSLCICADANLASRAVKDRRAFQLIYRQNSGQDQVAGGRLYRAETVWTVRENISGAEGNATIDADLAKYLQQWTIDFNAANLSGGSFMLAADASGLEEQKEICAFASGGISHSPTRAKDRHYSHLVEEASDWILLLQIESTELGPVRVLIRRSDLKERLFERAWLLLLKN